jgi:cation:H+ antiporter
MIFIYFAVMVISFFILFKCANLFVTGACEISDVLHIPKMITGIVFVGLATTAPEFGVSVISSFLGHPEYALGNAIGSVIADDGIAIGLAAIVAPAVIIINCKVLKIAGLFLLGIDYIAYFLARNGTIGRLEGGFFLFLLIVYFVLLYKTRIFFSDDQNGNNKYPAGQPSLTKWQQLKKPIILFMTGIIGVVVVSRFGVVWAALHITEYFHVPEIIVGSTVIAIGTSLPEVSTCIQAALKGEGELAVGNIIGADVLNILWIIGVSALVKPIHVRVDTINFLFPYMILMVTVMLLSMRLRCRLGKIKGLILILLYCVFLYLTLGYFA